MKFSRELLQHIAQNWNRPPNPIKIEDNIIDRSRWSVHYEMIFQVGDKFYRSWYRIGATEMQDESPYEYDEDEIECPEVHKVEKVVEVWEVV